jgi:uncharacterized protein
MQKILITGGSGLIGTKLTDMLLERGHDVSHLGRSSSKDRKVRTFIWDIKDQKIDSNAFEGVETVVHLAGANVGDKPWTKKRKQEILESRTLSTRLLFDFLKNTRHSVTTLVSASAIGYYGFGDEAKVFHEGDEPGNDFLAEVVRKWEAEVDAISALGIRIVKVRVGIVLSREAGALKEMVKPIKFYLGAALGKGYQKISWIHIDDVCEVFIKGIEDREMSGPVNAVGPVPVTNRELTEAIARTLGRPITLPAVPEGILKFFLGDMADLVLKGSTVSNKKLVDGGFKYRFPTLDAALQDLLLRG